MPYDELAVVVHVVGNALVDLDKVLITVLGSREATLGRLAEQALETVDEVLLGGVRSLVPLCADLDGAAGGLASEGVELGCGNDNVGLVGDHLSDVR